MNEFSNVNLFCFQKSAATHIARQSQGSRVEHIYMDWIWWILRGLPFHHLVRVMDCFLHEGVKVRTIFFVVMNDYST